MRMTLAALPLAAAMAATPALAEPSLFTFNGYMKESEGYCLRMMQGACDSVFGQCERGDGEVYYLDEIHNVSLGCDDFPDLGAVVFGVSAASSGDTADALRDRVLRMKSFIDSRL